MGVRETEGASDTVDEIIIDRAPTDDERIETREDRIDAIRADLHTMKQANRESPSPIYAGFCFIPRDCTPSSHEAPYLGAFLPLRVAERFPELLATETIGYDDVYCSDELPRGTQVIVAPGRFRFTGSGRLGAVFGSTLAFCLYALAAAVIAVVLFHWING